jgi:hypothetical protein
MVSSIILIIYKHLLIYITDYKFNRNFTIRRKYFDYNPISCLNVILRNSKYFAEVLSVYPWAKSRQLVSIRNVCHVMEEVIPI